MSVRAILWVAPVQLIVPVGTTLVSWRLLRCRPRRDPGSMALHPSADRQAAGITRGRCRHAFPVRSVAWPWPWPWIGRGPAPDWDPWLRQLRPVGFWPGAGLGACCASSVLIETSAQAPGPCPSWSQADLAWTAEISPIAVRGSMGPALLVGAAGGSAAFARRCGWPEWRTIPWWGRPFAIPAPIPNLRLSPRWP